MSHIDNTRLDLLTKLISSPAWPTMVHKPPSPSRPSCPYFLLWNERQTLVLVIIYLLCTLSRFVCSVQETPYIELKESDGRPEQINAKEVSFGNLLLLEKNIWEWGTLNSWRSAGHVHGQMGYLNVLVFFCVLAVLAWAGWHAFVEMLIHSSFCISVAPLTP